MVFLVLLYLGYSSTYEKYSQYVHALEKSNLTHLSSGVPQVLGTIPFSAQISPIGRLVSLYNLNHQQYADDTRLHHSLVAIDFAQSITTLETCLSHIHYRLHVNGLCLWFSLDLIMQILFFTTPPTSI